MMDNHLATKTHRPSRGLQPSQPSQPSRRGATASAALKAPLPPLHLHLPPSSRIHSPGRMPPLPMSSRASFNPPPRPPRLRLQLSNHTSNPTSLLHLPHLVCPLPVIQRLQQPVLILCPSAVACVCSGVRSRCSGAAGHASGVVPGRLRGGTVRPTSPSSSPSTSHPHACSSSLGSGRVEGRASR